MLASDWLTKVEALIGQFEVKAKTYEVMIW
jgi:hypothetical protein